MIYRIGLIFLEYICKKIRIADIAAYDMLTIAQLYRLGSREIELDHRLILFQ